MYPSHRGHGQHAYAYLTLTLTLTLALARAGVHPSQAGHGKDLYVGAVLEGRTPSYRSAPALRGRNIRSRRPAWERPPHPPGMGAPADALELSVSGMKQRR